MLIQVKSNKSIIIIGELEMYSHANFFFLSEKEVIAILSHENL